MACSYVKTHQEGIFLMDLICLAFAPSSFVKWCCASVAGHRVEWSRYIPWISKKFPLSPQNTFYEPFITLYACMRWMQMTEEAALNWGLLSNNSVLRVFDLNCQFDESCFWNAALFPCPQPIKLIHHCNYESWCWRCTRQGLLKRKWMNQELNFARCHLKIAQCLHQLGHQHPPTAKHGLDAHFCFEGKIAETFMCKGSVLHYIQQPLATWIKHCPYSISCFFGLFFF